MQNTVPAAARSSRLALDFPQSLAVYDDYATAQKAVDHLSDEQFRVQNLMIVGTDLKQVERITGRFTCATCGAGYHDSFKQPKVEGECDKCHGHEFKRRPDDNAETVKTRMAEYRAKTAPILPIYDARGLVRRVDGMADIGHVGVAIAAILDDR